MNMTAFMNWSGGKDSALAFYKAKKEGVPVEALLTSVNSGTDRIAMHGVRRELLVQQATVMGLPLHTIELPEMPGMQAYEEAVHLKHKQLKAAGFTHAVFGDLFLEDLKRYRDDLLAKDDLRCLYPLWQMNSREVVKEVLSLGFKAVVICVNSSFLDPSFCGRLLDESFLNDLPSNVDPCGENGEYHSFVFDGPCFSEALSFNKGELVFKEYAAPKGKDECFTAPMPKAGFYFQDLLQP
jgi:uncharacterized protein (TIGR00290 family)